MSRCIGTALTSLADAEGSAIEVGLGVVVQNGTNILAIPIEPTVQTTDPTYRPEGFGPGDLSVIPFGSKGLAITATPSPRNGQIAQGPMVADGGHGL